LTHQRAPDDNTAMSRPRVAVQMLAATVTVLAITVAALVLFAPPCSSAQTQGTMKAKLTPVQKGTPMSAHATGPFEVKLTPQDDKLDPTLGRMTIDKQFHGDLDATSKGQMLTASTDVKGSAGYVAVEHVTGTLRTSNGARSGSFSLQHTGTLTRGTPELNVTVVPDSVPANWPALPARWRSLLRTESIPMTSNTLSPKNSAKTRQS
jgi:hypothetical protein